MSPHLATKIPLNDEYAALLGKAVYVFAYYEWNIIYVIDSLENGFVSKYSRTESMVSRKVSGYFKEAIDSYKYFNQALPKVELEECHRKFSIIIEKRNALIHGHPITHVDGSQILAYQGKPSKYISDITWTVNEIENLIKEIDDANNEMGNIRDKLRGDTVQFTISR